MIKSVVAFAAMLALGMAATPVPEPIDRPAVVNPFDPNEIEVGFTIPDVDVELILMADVSSSMDAVELRQQRDGYVAALRSPEVAAAITDGAIGKIALSYAHFAGEKGQVVIVPWTIVDGADELGRFADVIEGSPDRAPSMAMMPAAYGTSVGGAISYAHAQITTNGLTGERAVIDVSGDGEDNSAAIKASVARDLAIAAGIQVNGLPIVTAEVGLERWYQDNVIGGPGAFLVPVEGFANFAEAVRRKLVLEIAGIPNVLVIPASISSFE